MKNILTLTVFVALLIMTITSCNKEENQSQFDINTITGTYSGTIGEIENYKTTQPATAIISLINETQLEIHCYSDLFDTTFIMDWYPHGDSLMLCATGNQFSQEYGHEKGNHHSGHQGASDNDWGHHMGEDHNPDDMHYGGFNMNSHRFGYIFRISENSDFRFFEFKGERVE
jgi:hypothetical protein